MTQRSLVRASLVTGLISLGSSMIGLTDPAYFDPVTVIDYFASVINSLGVFAAGVALIIWWRVTPVRRSALLILGAGIAMLLWSIGNVLEEILRLDLGETVYYVGSVGAFGLAAAAGIVTLTSPSRWRWSGLVLLAISAGIGFDAIPIWPIAWLGFAYVVRRGHLEESRHAARDMATPSSTR